MLKYLFYYIAVILFFAQTRLLTIEFTTGRRIWPKKSQLTTGKRYGKTALPSKVGSKY